MNDIMQMWNILFYISIGVFVLVYLIMKLCNLPGTKPIYPFHQDELIKNQKNGPVSNSLYFTYGVTKRYIKRYVFCHNETDKYLICEYTKKYDVISYYITCYNSLKKIIKIYRYTEYMVDKNSKVIPLPDKCKYVNIVIGKADNELLNSNIKLPLSINKSLAYSFSTALLFFNFVFALRHIIGRVIATKYYFESFLCSYFNYIFIAITFVFSIIVFIKCYRESRKKAKRSMKKGGALDYEFI